ncbi:glucosaminidase domain-containing protein [Marinobacterium sp. LSUCC0821]|jgi:Bax protein|uniref:glucosaminidase domain-containing protein n=1 Tax=Marinobacterium sp. LSUCC0821 TaxID=2668067 RepID=UPI0014526CDC|nr:glucosaminidase domain-containing protein [Marinobacterium sp. LSUCC0821]QJD71819.1 hypothetical protein HH196_09005 [Marinobacterium sp. LSUCC0821]
MIKRSIFAVTLSAATIFYNVSIVDPGAAETDRKALETLIESPRPSLKPNTTLTEPKQQFARLIMDYAEHENERLSLARAFIPRIVERQEEQKEIDPALDLLLKHFEIDPALPLEEIEEKLYLRVDGLSPALVATQAAIESGWGKSRFAVQGNNYFGIQCYSEGCGIKPKSSSNPSLEVRSFDTIGDAVAEYYQNINTHSAYLPLREQRLSIRNSNRPLLTVDLIPTLGSYSEIGDEYLQILTSVFNSSHIQGALQSKAEQG